ncbi:MAG: single-stranded-DNA-specific exonuclease RecJ, partial [Verrucomicrobia bacterium]|nr:single-stranded-DNA-specific exonuclease RecJ [Verrucomicrobiota bacterium]
TNDAVRAQTLATELESQNRYRQSVEEKTFDEASRQLASTFLQERDAAIVVGAKGWHPGVVGIVASRFSKQFHRPTFVIGFDESGDGRGSGRSIAGLSLVKALDECREFLIQFGGHDMAGGVRISLLQLEAFSEAFRAVAQRMLSPDRLQPRLRLAAELRSTEIDFQLLRCHELMEPFGVGNPQPIFYIRHVVPASEPKLLKDKHWLFALRPVSTECSARQLEAIYFNGVSVPLPSPPWDVAFYVGAKYHENRIQVQLQVEAMRTANE